jgi:hypothetical protein
MFFYVTTDMLVLVEYSVLSFFFYYSFATPISLNTSIYYHTPRITNTSASNSILSQTAISSSGHNVTRIEFLCATFALLDVFSDMTPSQYDVIADIDVQDF